VSRDGFLPSSGFAGFPYHPGYFPRKMRPLFFASNEGRHLVTFSQEGPTQVGPNKTVCSCNEYTHGEVPPYFITLAMFLR
jgi:hypothetical protein